MRIGNEDPNHAVYTENLTEGWFNLTLQQLERAGSYQYSIYIDDNKIYTIINKTPRSWSNVRAFFALSDFKNHKIANGSYRNLQVISKLVNG